jgi:hypothetical protein
MAWVIIGWVMIALAIPALFIMEDAGAIDTILSI